MPFKGDPVLYASNPEGIDRDVRRMSLDTLRELNEMQAKEFGHPETQTRIAQYELAFRMQTSVPEVMDISRESKETIETYGAKPGESSFANNCLLARRLVEQGVRYVQLFDWGWDFHGTSPSEDIRDGLTKKCATMDKPVAALIKDLRQRGLLLACDVELCRARAPVRRPTGGLRTRHRFRPHRPVPRRRALRVRVHDQGHGCCHGAAEDLEP